MIYLDNAATSFPKPFSVGAALLDTLTTPIGNPGRGGHAAACAASELVYSVRETLSEMFQVGAPERVVFFKNATESLNAALLGLLDRHDGKIRRVVTTTLEHNSVLRPLYYLEKQGQIALRFFSPAQSERETLLNFQNTLFEKTDLVAFTACANTTGERLPVESLARAAKAAGAYVVVDASQAAGHAALAFDKNLMDCLCFPAHKGLYGITGLGVLLAGDFSPALCPRLFGGAGFESRRREMPALLPERLEAGTLPVHPIAALKAGLGFLQARGVSNLAAREEELAERLRAGLRSLNLTVYGPGGGSIVLFNVPGRHSEEVAESLNDAGIAVRGGLHCAPKAHEMLKTLECGALRASFGAFNDEADVDKTLNVLEDYLKKHA